MRLEMYLFCFMVFGFNSSILYLKNHLAGICFNNAVTYFKCVHTDTYGTRTRCHTVDIVEDIL